MSTLIEAADFVRRMELPALTLPVKRIYFEQIAAGEKPEEFRLANAFWAKRLEGKQFSSVIVTLGYPKKTDTARRLEFPWRGFTKKTITHEHFGQMPVEVYAISLRRPIK